MSRTTIFTIYILFDLMVFAGVLWCAAQHIPMRQYLIPAVVLFVLGGLWLIVMTIRHTAPRE